MVHYYFKRIVVVLLILVLFGVSFGSALNVDLKPIPNPQSKEGDVVNFQMTITGIPQQTSFIALETDLEPYNNTPLWYISDASEYGINNSSPDLMQRKLRIYPTADLVKPITIVVSGKVPSIKQVSPVNGVVFCNVAGIHGLRYYTVQPYDSTGYAVGTSDTKIFDINPSSPCNPPDVSQVQDPEMREYVQELRDKGLWPESNKMIDYSKKQPVKVSLLIYIVSLIIVGGVMFIIGYRSKKCRKIEVE